MIKGSRSKRTKEAETVKLSAIPENPVKFKAWKSDVRAQIAASSGKADKGLVWERALGSPYTNLIKYLQEY
jgi:hypothetical protein